MRGSRSRAGACRRPCRAAVADAHAASGPDRPSHVTVQRDVRADRVTPRRYAVRALAKVGIIVVDRRQVVRPRPQFDERVAPRRTRRPSSPSRASTPPEHAGGQAQRGGEERVPDGATPWMSNCRPPKRLSTVALACSTTTSRAPIQPALDSTVKPNSVPSFETASRRRVTVWVQTSAYRAGLELAADERRPQKMPISTAP